MKYFASRLSENLAETPEGYLLCLGVSIGRTGSMDYHKSEVPLEAGADEIVKVSRDEEEVFRPETIASFEGKPFTIKHPEQFVSPENWKELAHGVMQNVRRGEGDQKDDLVCDLLITDLDAISLVRNGVRGLSCGYEAEYIQTGIGTGKQVKIIGNHLALVEEGRAGKEYEIKDHKGVSAVDKKIWERLKKMLIGKTVDAASLEKAMADAEKEPQENAPAVMDQGMYDELVKICNAMNEKLGAMKPKDEKEEKVAPKKEGEDEPVESGLEDRLKKLEMAVSKLLEGQSGDESEEEMSDEDPEEGPIADESEEESEDKEMEMIGDTAERAEILAPGIKVTKDVKVKALKAAYGTKDGKKVIDALTGGKSPSFNVAEKVETLFIAASEILKSQRGEELSNSKRFKVGDFQPTIFNGEGHMSAEKMNELNEKRYNSK